MPFFGKEFLDAVEGYPDAVAVGYLRALWHYWNHTHCRGLPTDDEYLRRLCRCESETWPATKAIIFDNEYFFCMNGTHWHQKMAKQLHDKHLELYNRRLAWAANARSHKGVNTNVNANVNTNEVSPAREITLRGEYERVLEELETLRARYAPRELWNPKDTQRRSVLIGRREELRKTLNIVA